MGKWIMADTRRELVAIEVVYKGQSIGWVEPDDYLAFVEGDLDEAGLLSIARLMPDPPTGTVRQPKGVAYYVED